MTCSILFQPPFSCLCAAENSNERCYVVRLSSPLSDAGLSFSFKTLYIRNTFQRITWHKISTRTQELRALPLLALGFEKRVEGGGGVWLSIELNTNPGCPAGLEFCNTKDKAPRAALEQFFFWWHTGHMLVHHGQKLKNKHFLNILNINIIAEEKKTWWLCWYWASGDCGCTMWSSSVGLIK